MNTGQNTSFLTAEARKPVRPKTRSLDFLRGFGSVEVWADRPLASSSWNSSLTAGNCPVSGQRTEEKSIGIPHLVFGISQPNRWDIPERDWDVPVGGFAQSLCLLG
jgi:hypothetical protein